MQFVVNQQKQKKLLGNVFVFYATPRNKLVEEFLYVIF